MMKRHSLLQVALVAALACSISACSILKKNLDRSLNDPRLEQRLSELTTTIVDKTLQQMGQDTTLAPLKAQLAEVLDSLQLTADMTSQQLIENLLGARTKELVQIQLDSVRQQLRMALSHTGTFLETDVANFIQRRVLLQLELSLQNWLNTLRRSLADAEMEQSLNQFRRYLTAELDTLMWYSSASLAKQMDSLIVPRLDSLFLDLNTFSQDTEKKASNLLAKILLGVAGLLLLGMLVYQFLWKNRYRRMLEIVTKEIDQITEQETYDELVGNVKKELAQANLRKPMDQLLEKQRLLKQPEWQEKDQQVVQLLIKELQKQAPKPPEQQEEVIKELEKAAEEKGLREHLLSILRRKS